MNPVFQSIKRLAAALLLVSVASCSGSGDNTPTGKITFWADQTTIYYGSTLCGTENIRVMLDGVDIGPLVYRLTEPKCGDFTEPNVISRNVTIGLHNYSSTNGTCSSLPVDYTVKTDSCLIVRYFTDKPSP